METNKYSKGKIYKLVAKVYEGECIPYYGSTCQEYLSSRLSGHKAHYKCYLNGKHRFLTSFKLFENYGIENVEIILVEDFPCDNKYQLEARENFYIVNNECLNKIHPTRTIKEWYSDNLEKITEQTKEYRKNNLDKIKEYNKEYKIINGEKIKEYHKEYRINNDEKIKEYYRNNIS